MADPVPDDVLQAAREAAASFLESPMSKWCRGGLLDDRWAVQAAAVAILSERARAAIPAKEPSHG